MTNHETESSMISELNDNIDNETNAIINTNGDIKQIGIVVSTKGFDEFVKELRKTCHITDKICYNLLKELTKNVKALVSLLISSSINNSFVPANRKEFLINMIPKQDRPSEGRKLPTH